MNIPDEAVEALARLLANEELFRADCEGYGWDSEKDSSDHFMPTARKKAMRILEAAAPMLMEQAWNEGFSAALSQWRKRSDLENPYRQP